MDVVGKDHWGGRGLCTLSERPSFNAERTIHSKYKENGKAGGGQHHWVYEASWSKGKGMECKIKQKWKD